MDAEAYRRRPRRYVVLARQMISPTNRALKSPNRRLRPSPARAASSIPKDLLTPV